MAPGQWPRVKKNTMGREGFSTINPENPTSHFLYIVFSEKQIINEGTGATPQRGQTMVMHYVGTLENGTVFDSSRNKNKPFKFQLGNTDAEVENNFFLYTFVVSNIVVFFSGFIIFYF